MEKSIETASGPATLLFQQELKHYQQALFGLFDQGNLQQKELAKSMQLAINAMHIALNSGGKMLFTGIGKNVPACQKLSESCASLHLPASYFDPISAVHGSMGVLQENDVVMWFSRSGTTAELQHSIESMKRYQPGLTIIGVYMDQAPGKQSRIPITANHHLCLPYLPEHDNGWDLVPTVSAIAFQIIGDILMTHIAQQLVGLTKEDFVRSHPGGSIGETKIQ